MECKNPAPVVVGLVYVSSNELVIVRRNIEPHKGGWALPGGYIEYGENWREALKREIREEAQIHVSTDEKHMVVHDIRSTPDGSKILLFAVIHPKGVEKILTFRKNKEVSERKTATVDYYQSPRLCFPLHAAAVEKIRSNISFDDQHPGGW